MKNNPVFQQLNNAQGQNLNPAMFKVQLENKLKEMQSSRVNADAEIKKGISEGKINQKQVDFAYGIARNIAKNLFGHS